MTVKFTNNASTTVATGINTTATSLVVASAAGFPALSGSGDYCYLTIQQAAGTNVEVVKATALSSNTFTIVRAQDGTSAGSWSVSDVVELRVTAALLTDIVDAATHDSNVLAVDSTNNRVGVNDTTPSVTLDISGTDAIALPVGTTAERPTGAAGRFRYNSSLSQFEGYTDAWGAIGGGGTNTFTTDTFTANGSLVAFNLSQTVASANNLLCFIDGVFQTQDAYAIATASGTTTLTFSAAPANARKIVVYSVAAGISGSNLNIDSMTGDGSDVTLTLSIAPVTINNTIVTIDGVYQAKANYSISGTTLTFSTAPPTGSAVEVMTFTQTEINVPIDGTITSAKLSGDLTTPGALTVTGALAGTSAAFSDVVSVSNANARFRLFETDTTDLNTQLQNQGGDFKIARLDDDAGASTVQFTIDHATGNVGIGASPLTLSGNAAPGLTVSSNGPFILLQDANNADKVRYISNNTGELQFGIVGDDGATGKTEHMRIDASGNLLVGTTTHRGFSGSTTEITIGTAGTGATAGGAVTFDSGSGFLGYLAFQESEGTLGTLTSVPLVFKTGNTERMRLTSGGSFQAKGPETNYISNSEYHQFAANIASIAMYVFNANSAAGAAGILINVANELSNSNGYFLRGYSNSTARDNIYIYTNGNVENRAGGYGQFSDVKLKQDIADANNQWQDFKSIRFRKYRFKDDVASNANAPFYLGVVAQELEAAGLNGLVSESPDKEFYQQTVTDDDGNDVLDEDGNAVTEQQERLTGETTKSVKMSILYAKGMVALQEAMARIETLEAKVQTLENN